MFLNCCYWFCKIAKINNWFDIETLYSIGIWNTKNFKYGKQESSSLLPLSFPLQEISLERDDVVRINKNPVFLPQSLPDGVDMYVGSGGKVVS